MPSIATPRHPSAAISAAEVLEASKPPAEAKTM